ncbi:MAG: hypothetical protein CMJ25_32705 [Phycisphaerae bacterium]|nr:hypothetical protein [Phycisphaerae bacterium]
MTENTRPAVSTDLPSNPSDFERISWDVFPSPDQARRVRFAMDQSREAEKGLVLLVLMIIHSDDERSFVMSRDLEQRITDLKVDLVGYRQRYKLEVMARTHLQDAYLNANVFEEELQALLQRRDLIWEQFVAENNSLLSETYHSLYPIEH